MSHTNNKSNRPRRVLSPLARVLSFADLLAAVQEDYARPLTYSRLQSTLRKRSFGSVRTGAGNVWPPSAVPHVVDALREIDRKKQRAAVT